MEYLPGQASRFPRAQAFGEVLSTTILVGIGVCVAVLAWAAFAGPSVPETSLEPITSTAMNRTPGGFVSVQPAGASILVIALSDDGARDVESLLAHEGRVRKLVGEAARVAWVVTAANGTDAAAIAESVARDAQLPGAQQVTVVVVP